MTQHTSYTRLQQTRQPKVVSRRNSPAFLFQDHMRQAYTSIRLEMDEVKSWRAEGPTPTRAKTPGGMTEDHPVESFI